MKNVAATQPREDHFLFLDLHTLAERTDDPRKALRVALRSLREFHAADAVLAARRTRVGRRRILGQSPKLEAAQIEELLEGLGRERRPGRISTTVARQGRRWADIALYRADGGFTSEEWRRLQRAGEVLSRQIAQMDDKRIREVRSRIDRKIIGQLEPSDLFYQVLHGIRTLTRFDHSSTLYIFEEPVRTNALPSYRVSAYIAAELLRPRTKSERIQTRCDVDRAGLEILAGTDIRTYDRTGVGWAEVDPAEAGLLDSLLTSGEAPEGYGDPDSVILCPLVSGRTVLGALVIAYQEAGAAGVYESRLIEEFRPHVLIALRNLSRFEHLRSELAEARRFQESMLPAECCGFAGGTICYRVRPCEQLGGDFLDLVGTEPGAERTVILVADVSGHGARAAMTTAVLKAAFRDRAPDGDPTEVLQALSRGIRFFDPTMMVTALCLEVLWAEGTVRYANAGHPNPLLFPPDGPPRELPEGGLPISPALPGDWGLDTVEVTPGTRILGYTDGLVDSEDTDQETELRGLVEVVSRNETGGLTVLDELIDRATTRDHAPGRYDDCTAFLLEVSK